MTADRASEPHDRLAALCADADPLDVVELAGLGPVLVVIPHPDDESLGCGGLLARLHDAGAELWPALVTDGAASHPNSRAFDAAARAALRDSEWCAALAALGVGPARAIRLGFADGALPSADEPSFAPAVARFREVIDAVDPALVVMPWRRDPHADHRAANALTRASFGDRWLPPRVLEYLVWTSERAAADDLPEPGEVQCWQLDIGTVLDRKAKAIACHRSQLGAVIDDDPDGFVLSAGMRRRVEAPVEYFFEGHAP